ncbi:MAG: cysteine desulfurase [Candidatus Gracilibacteria bacterium]|nr:cysteine desulfurase [Candidatus Gracilibacteria bacterium]
MYNLKSDFPIFENNPGLIFMDSTATSQKPKQVIDAISSYYSNYNSNIHRGSYDIAQISEELYEKSKQVVADKINAKNKSEIIYSYNSTYASNLFIMSLKRSGMLKKGDKVLVTISEHHANVVPWLILKEEIGIEIDYVNFDENYDLDLEDFKAKYDDSVKVVSFTYVSNVVGTVYDLESVSKLLRDDTLFIVDGSQSVPHMYTDVRALNCDAMFFTGHKVMAENGLGILYIKEELMHKMEPAISGGGAIAWVKKEEFKSGIKNTKFEAGTPNVAGAVSLLAAFEYIDNIGGYKKVEEIEADLVKYFLKKLDNFPEEIKLIGKKTPENRVGVFSFSVDGIHANDISDALADDNICVRAGRHCADPLADYCEKNSTCRASLYIYNTRGDIDKFFESLEKAINLLK